VVIINTQSPFQFLKIKDKAIPNKNIIMNMKNDTKLCPILLWNGLPGGSIRSGKLAPQMDIKKQAAAKMIGNPDKTRINEKIKPIIPPAASCCTPSMRNFILGPY
jgi:hypothetical protein